MEEILRGRASQSVMRSARTSTPRSERQSQNSAERPFSTVETKRMKCCGEVMRSLSISVIISRTWIPFSAA